MPQSSSTKTIIVSSSAWVRRRHACRWLEERCRQARPLLVVANQLGAVGELIHQVLTESSETGGAPEVLSGLHRMTLELLAREVLAGDLAEEGAVVATEAARAAVVVRIAGELSSQLRHYSSVVETPGFGQALGRTLDELRHHGVPPEALFELPQQAAQELGLLLQGYERALEQERLLDRAALYFRAAQKGFSDHWASDALLLLYDVRVWMPSESSLVHALARDGAEAQFVVPGFDQRTLTAISALGTVVQVQAEEGPADVVRLQQRLFARSEAEAAEGEGVSIFSAPSADLECLEIARRTAELVQGGYRADQVAVLLRHTTPYVSLLHEAFERVGMEIYAAEGALLPDPAGRAFLLLLRCASEGLPATLFGEYLSLGQVPGLETESEPSESEPPESHDYSAEDESPQDTPKLRRPLTSRWERLIGDASVTRRFQRWQSRLEGLRRELDRRKSALQGADDGATAALERDVVELDELSAFALPLLSQLHGLTCLDAEMASWARWLPALEEVARCGIARPARVLDLLEELRPLCRTPATDVGVSLLRVIEALSPRLRDLRRRPPKQRYGRVYVGLAGEALGRVFDAVFVPGLAERSFPAKVLQDPVLLDRTRAQLEDAGAEGPSLSQAPHRRQMERAMLQVAVGAARCRVTLSYPRMELAKGRPRVPSFYLLEAARAVQGTLPDHEALISDAAAQCTVTLERPFAREVERAVDVQEYDLSVLVEARRLRYEGPEMDLSGYAGHLHEHAFVVPALRAHWQRAGGHKGKGKRLGRFDGLVVEDATTRVHLSAHALTRRAYGVTSLERFARCPYRFYLSGVLRLPTNAGQVPLGAELLDPRTRGTIIHTLLQEVARTLLQQGLLPLAKERHGEAVQLAVDTLERVVQEFKDDLDPAVDLLWQQEVRKLGADLLSWLSRELDRGDRPVALEQSFGGDASQVVVGERGYRLRGAIDRVDRLSDGALMVTDYKTGAVPDPLPSLFDGGRTLQRVLYAMAWEAEHPGEQVNVGRLYYCTERGGFVEAAAPITEGARGVAESILETIDQGIRDGVLPALPADEGECQRCDYRRVCGKDAFLFARRKEGDVRAARLKRVRGT